MLAALAMPNAVGAQPPPATAIPPVPPAPPAAVQWSPPRSSLPTPAEAVAVYENEKKSHGVALLLEFIFPGVGSIYADNFFGAATTYMFLIGGVAMLLWGVSQYDGSHGHESPDATTEAPPHNNDMPVAAIAGGMLLMTGGRVYGFVNAWSSVNDHNEYLRERLGLDDRFAFGIAPLVATEEQVTAAPFVRFRF